MKGGQTILTAGALALGAILGWEGSARLLKRQDDAPHPAKSDREPSMAEGIGAGSVAGAGSPDSRLRAVIGQAHSLNEEELVRSFLEGDLGTGDPTLDTLFAQIVTDRILAIDPERCISTLLERNHRWTGSSFLTWARRDVSAAESFLLALNDRRRVKTLAQELLTARLEKDPVAALELIPRLFAQAGSEFHLGTSNFSKLAKSHRTELLAAAKNWPTKLQRHAEVVVAHEWLQTDFTGAMAWLEGMDHQATLLRQALQHGRDLGSVFLEKWDDLEPDLRRQLAEGTGYSLVSGNPLGWLRRDAESLGLEEELVSKLHEGAARHIESNNHELAEEALPLLKPSARNDLLKRMKKPAGEGAPESASYYEQLRWTPEEYIAELAATGDAPAPSGWSPATRWTAEDVARARTQVEQLTEAERRQLAPRASQFPPVLATDLYRITLDSKESVESELTADERKRFAYGLSRGVSLVARDWAYADAPAAAAWVTSLPDGDERFWAAQNLVSVWIDQDPAAARGWANNLTNDTDREAVLKVIELGGEIPRQR